MVKTIDYLYQSDILFTLTYRAAKEIFDLDKCTGVDLSEDMLRVAEQLEGKLACFLFSAYTGLIVVY